MVVTQTCPNCDTTTLATAIRAGHPPTSSGLNDIDVPEFSKEGVLMNLTKYIDALPYKKALSPGHLGLGVTGGRSTRFPTSPTCRCCGTTRSSSSRPGLNPNQPPTSSRDPQRRASVNKLGNGVSGFSFAGDCQGCLGFVMQPDLWAVR